MFRSSYIWLLEISFWFYAHVEVLISKYIVAYYHANHGTIPLYLSFIFFFSRILLILKSHVKINWKVLERFW